MSTSTKTSKSAEQAAEFLAAAINAGFHVVTKDYGGTGGAIIEVTTVFAANDAPAYIKAERDAYALLRMVPIVSYGSTWGSTSGSVGGHAALTSGHFHLCTSGASKRFVAAVNKLNK